MLLHRLKWPVPATLMSMAMHVDRDATTTLPGLSLSYFHSGQFGILKSSLFIRTPYVLAGSPRQGEIGLSSAYKYKSPKGS